MFVFHHSHTYMFLLCNKRWMRLRNLVCKFCSCPITTKSTYQQIQTLSITETASIFLLESPALKESLSSGQPWGHIQRHRSGLHEQITNYFLWPLPSRGGDWFQSFTVPYCSKQGLSLPKWTRNMLHSSPWRHFRSAIKLYNKPFAHMHTSWRHIRSAQQYPWYYVQGCTPDVTSHRFRAYFRLHAKGLFAYVRRQNGCNQL